MVQSIDFRHPDYTAVYADRAERLKMLRGDNRRLAACRIWYRRNPWDFISDWGMTFDPRNLERDLPANVPFVLWERQREYLEWLYEMWRGGERGLVEKSRDCGVTWLSVGFAISMFLFEPGFAAGFGSRKEDLVDKKGDPDAIFEKIRFFFTNLPIEFLPPGFNEREHSAHMKLLNPDGGASITGEAGDNIGRGGRKSIYIVDEAATVERQMLVDSALSMTTNCQIDVSTVNGSGNEFYKKRMRWDGTHKIFIFDWRDDPRKDQAWYDAKCEDLDPVIVAQEIDRDYNASAEDAFIPAAWVKAAIDAHVRLGFEPSGIRVTALDPADTGDAKAIVNRHGSVITDADQTRTDITQAMPWAFHQADEHRADVLRYDGDGMGSPTMKMTLTQLSAGRMKVIPYHGSAQVEKPDDKYIYGAGEDIDQSELKTNYETFKNYRAQTWTWVRDRFRRTYDAVERAKKGYVVNADPEQLISISSDCKQLQYLVAEISRPKRIYTENGLILVESKKAMKARGVESPNLSDSAIIAFATRSLDQGDKSKPRRIRGMRNHMEI